MHGRTAVNKRRKSLAILNYDISKRVVGCSVTAADMVEEAFECKE
jgi:hypothetical protein